MPFPQEESFKVWAQEDRSGALYLEAEAVSYDGGWFASRDWPADELRFEACWPLDLPVEFSRSEGLQIRNFDCTVGDVDILMAEADGDNQVDGLVAMSFNHILSRVEFRMRHSLSDEMSVKVRKIELKGFAQKGDYNTKASDQWSSSDYTGSRVVFDVGEGEGVELPAGDVQYFGKDFFALPQVSAPEVEVTYEVRYANAGWVTQTETIEHLDTEWDPGKHYTYTLNLRMDKLVYTTGISSWNNRD